MRQYGQLFLVTAGLVVMMIMSAMYEDHLKCFQPQHIKQ